MNLEPAHPDRAQWQALLERRLSAHEAAVLTAHLQSCRHCEAVVDALVRDMGAPFAAHRQASHHANEPKRPWFLGPPAHAGWLGTFGAFDVLDQLGCGGDGYVFRAVRKEGHAVVALKVLAPELASDPEAVRRFLRGARAAMQVDDEHVVRVLAVHESNPMTHCLPYLVMEFVDGESLQELLERHRPFPLEEIVHIGAEIAEGLAAFHECRLLHRDVKPGNILLARDTGMSKLIDFGLTRTQEDVTLLSPGTIAGTPAYMAPEQARGKRSGVRSDLYSLGSVLYALCTGRPPFTGTRPLAVLNRVRRARPLPIHNFNPETPPWLVEIIARLHAPRPADRFPSAGEVAALLRHHLAHLRAPGVVPLPARLPPPRPRQFSPHLGLVFLLIGLVSGALLAGCTRHLKLQGPAEAAVAQPRRRQPSAARFFSA